jgi:hypothetical protein
VPPTFLFNGNPGFLPRVKRLGREADHISPLSVEAKNEKRSTYDHSVFLRGVIMDNCNFLHRHIYRQRLTVTPSPVVTNRKWYKHRHINVEYKILKIIKHKMVSIKNTR